MHFNLINSQKRDKRSIKVGFDWPSFFSPSIYGIPHFLRGQSTLGIVLLLVGIINTVPSFIEPTGTEEEQMLFFTIMLIFWICISIYFGKNGQKMLAKHLLENGYEFEDENSDIVSQCKTNWGII